LFAFALLVEKKINVTYEDYFPFLSVGIHVHHLDIILKFSHDEQTASRILSVRLSKN